MSTSVIRGKTAGRRGWPPGSGCRPPPWRAGRRQRTDQTRSSCSWTRPATRIPELVPVRHGRMSASPFAFFRGGALIMAADIAPLPLSGITVQVCGDAHLVNFGLFASPERDLLFDINDFDETLAGAWEWDLMRLSASLVVGRPVAFVQRPPGSPCRAGGRAHLSRADGGVRGHARHRRLLRARRRPRHRGVRRQACPALPAVDHPRRRPSRRAPRAAEDHDPHGRPAADRRPPAASSRTPRR